MCNAIAMAECMSVVPVCWSRHKATATVQQQLSPAWRVAAAGLTDYVDGRTLLAARFRKCILELPFAAPIAISTSARIKIMRELRAAQHYPNRGIVIKDTTAL